VWWLTPDRYSFIVPNHRRGPLADARFRQALSLLWDRTRLADEVHHGLARPIGAPTFARFPLTPWISNRPLLCWRAPVFATAMETVCVTWVVCPSA